MMRKNGEISIFGDLEATSRAIIVRAEEEARKIILSSLKMRKNKKLRR